jgi:peptidoglycan/LPS O-acetylase OafA/YrhL
MKFRALESWRGICAIGVVLVHFSGLNHFQDFPPVQNAGRGVDFFFVLSGFVLAHAYGERLRSSEAAVPFLIRRFGRLYPLHLFTLGALLVLEIAKLGLMMSLHVGVGAEPFTQENSLVALGANLLLLNGVGLLHYYSWNGPSWSISTEFWVYLAFLAVCLAGKPASRWLALAIALLTGGLLLAINVVPWKLHVYDGLGLLRCVFGFFLGTLTHALYQRSRDSIERLPRGGEWLAVGLAALVFFDILPWPALTSPLAFAAIIWVFAFESGGFSRVLSTPAPLYLGTISYSAYLVHFPILAVLNGVCRVADRKLHLNLYVPTTSAESADGLLLNFGSPWITDAVEVLYVLLVIAVASGTYRWIEAPGRQYFNGLATRLELGRAKQVTARAPGE